MVWNRRGVAATSAVVGLVAVAAAGCGGGDTSPRQATAPSTASPAVSSAPASTSTSVPPPLFTAAPPAAAGQPTYTAQGTPKRARYVSFDPSLLPATADHQKIDLTFFDDARFTATITHMQTQALLTSWSGTLGSPHSIFVAVRSGDIYSVTASTVEGTFTMVQTPSGLYQVQEADQPQPTGSDMVESLASG